VSDTNDLSDYGPFQKLKHNIQGVMGRNPMGRQNHIYKNQENHN